MHSECFPEQGWNIIQRLKKIFMKHNAILAGGTALALHIGHRESYDLDFFTMKKFSAESVIRDVRKSRLPFQIISEEEGSLVFEARGIKMSLFRYDYPFLEKPVMYKGIQIADVLDIASMKVIAISQRGTKRDFVDVYTVLQDIPFHRIATHMVKRFGKERINPVHIGKSMVYFSDADAHPDPAYIKGAVANWETVKKFFRAHVKQFVLDLDATLR